MALGYSKPLYLLAFDHRGSFERDLFRATPPISNEVRTGIIAAKEIIYDGFVEAVRQAVPVEAAGVLTDEQYGAGVARRAKADGHLLAMPVERSGQPEFEFSTARTSAPTSRHSTLNSSRCWCVTTPRAIPPSMAARPNAWPA